MDTDKHRLKIMKYNKWTLIIGVAALLATVSTFAQTNPPAAAPALTPAQIDNLGNGLNAVLPLLPAKAQSVLVGLVTLLGVIATVGRLLHGTVLGDLVAWVLPKFTHGLVFGTNAPTEFAGAPPPPKGATQLKSFLLIGLLAGAVGLLTGCQNQIVEAASGSGVKTSVAVPIPMSGGQTLIGASLTVGSWKSVTVVQPSNAVVTVVQTTIGAQTVSGSVVTNAQAGLGATQYDNNVLATGAGKATITNNAATLNQ